jgi:hypothetical protein
LTAVLPYLAAVTWITTLIQLRVGTPWAAVIQAGVGLGLIIMSVSARLHCVKLSGVLVLLIGTVTCGHGLYRMDETLLEMPRFYFIVIGLSLTFVIAERLWRRLQRLNGFIMLGDRLGRAALVWSAAVIGLMALYVTVPDTHKALAWLAMAMAVAFAGAIFAERLYETTALALILVVVAWTYMNDLGRLDESAYLFQFALALGAAFGILGLSWALALRRAKRIQAQLSGAAPNG